MVAMAVNTLSNSFPRKGTETMKAGQESYAKLKNFQTHFPARGLKLSPDFALAENFIGSGVFQTHFPARGLKPSHRP
jgi:hypothetical protein